MDLNWYTKKELSQVPLYKFVGDLNLRLERMSGLMARILAEYKNPKILDLAMGAGHDSIFLLKKNCKVISNEIDKFSEKIAQERAKIAKVKLEIRHSRWEKMHKSLEYKPEEFDFIFSLGNSFPNYLLKKEARERALRNFWHILKPGGTLLFDTRNFDYMLNNTEKILKDPEKNFKYLYKTTYLGKSIKAFPMKITRNKIRFVWLNYKTQSRAELDLWPATLSNIMALVKSVLGEIDLEAYFDYQKKKPAHYDFVQYVFKKSK